LKQYGIRLRQELDGISWEEFCVLLSGLMPNTPLGRIVGIRAEENPEVIKNFNSDQKRIRNDWLKRHGGGLSALTNMQFNLKAMSKVVNK
jgi:hypothetical protein